MIVEQILASADNGYLQATLRSVHLQLYGVSPGKKDHTCDIMFACGSFSSCTFLISLQEKPASATVLEAKHDHEDCSKD